MMAPPEIPREAPLFRKRAWAREAGLRFKALWPVKLAGVPVFITLFFIGYFFVMGHPLFPQRTMPFTALDRLVGFQPAALFLYLTLWVYVSLAPAFMDDISELTACALIATGIAVAGFAFFLVWPTSVPRQNIDWEQYRGFAWLKTVDRQGNACPSLHVAFALFSGLCLDGILRRMRAPGALRILNSLWCAGILYSTLATKQHVAVDLYAGAALGLAGAVLFEACREVALTGDYRSSHQ